MQSSVKAVLLAISVAAVMITFVLGSVTSVLAQTTPTTTNLVKRDYSYSNDQHLTARFGNDRVCGDHLCAPGEWAKLQQNLNQAQIAHPSTNSTKSVSSPTITTNSTQSVSSPTITTNATSQMQSQPVPPTPTPIPTPPAGPSAVCVKIKAVLENSAVPSTTVTRIMADLGCSS